MITLITIVVLINLFAAYYYYNHITGRIDEARQLYEAAYGSSADFNSIFLAVSENIYWRALINLILT